MAMLRSQFQRFLFPGLREVIKIKYQEIPLQYTQLFNVLSSSKAFEEDVSIAGVGLLVEQPENVESAEDQWLPGFAKRYQHIKYALKVGISEQMRRQEQTGFWKQRGEDLGFSTRQTKEILHAGYIDAGATTSLGPDGVALFSNAHPNIRLGTQSNVLNPAASLSTLAVRLMLTQFRRFFDDTGVRRIQLQPKYLVVPPELEFEADEILKSAERPDTANRATNVIYRRLSTFCWVYLLDTNNWYIFPDKGMHKLKSYNSIDLKVTQFMDDDTEIQWVKSATEFSFGHSHWLGPIASLPA